MLLKKGKSSSDRGLSSNKKPVLSNDIRSFACQKNLKERYEETDKWSNSYVYLLLT
ncbi:hypothetical protein CHCC14562_4341 [Bacillus licheniformis]|nr:hypothetical protein CHCC14562_4341 [Bacillus licheniformis]